MSDFKSVASFGQLEVAHWKDPVESPNLGLAEESVELHKILHSRSCSSLLEEDILAWTHNPKGVYSVASGYQVLLAQKLTGAEVHWWKRVWNKLSWPKCNCFVWTLAWNRCLTWDNIRKQGFQGPSICVLCGGAKEDSSHLFFRCPFVVQL